MLMPSLAPLHLAMLPPTLLWIVVVPLQQRSPPLHPFAPFTFPQNVTPQLCLPLILQWKSTDILVLSTLLNTNVICFYAKTQLQMFQLYLCLELSSMQIVFSPYMSSLLHIPKMTMNVMVTLQPMVE
jgi:hypothetical protein